MRDSSKLLDFNPNRELEFEPFRKVEIELRRKYAFDLNRKLNFDLNRELNIRNRGVVFRGYICPNCKASVGADETHCEECGIGFEPIAKDQKKQKKRWERGERKAVNVQKASTLPPPSKDWSRNEQRITLHVCPVCGQLLAADAVFCSNCGSKLSTRRGSSGTYTNSRSSHDTSKRHEGKGRKIQIKRQKDSTVSWDEYKRRDRKHGIVSWDEYSRRKKE